MAELRKPTLNRETDLLKLLAIILMTVDHAGAALCGNAPLMRSIGRLAFPIFCYTLAVGCGYTRSMGKHALRLLIAALVSQPFYTMALHSSDTLAETFASWGGFGFFRWYAFTFNKCNIMVELLMGVLLIWTLKEKRFVLSALVAAAVIVLDRQGWLSSSYGVDGIFLIAIFWVFRDRPAACLAWAALYMIQWGTRSGSSYTFLGLHYGRQMYAVLALPLIAIPIEKRHVKLPKWLFYAYYPAHLMVIAILRELIL